MLPSRYLPFAICAAALVLSLVMIWDGAVWRWLAVLSGALTTLGVVDLMQTRHALRRNFPITAHIRTFFEYFRPMLRQYVVESDMEEVPFSHMQRAIVYQRAKNILDKRPFGTELDVYADNYEWINHSLAPAKIDSHDFRLAIGGDECTQPYSASVFNISAMSFGSLSANAIRALNEGARRGGFYHDTGEGSISAYHRENGGDICWEIGSGYFGCRESDGTFSEERFVENALLPQVKMIEIKLSQGAKPGHGGVLARGEGLRGDLTRARRADGRGLRFTGARTARSRRRSACSSSSRACARSPAASRPASSSRSAIRGNGSASPRRCSKAASCPTSSSSTAAKAAPARRRSSSPTMSARRCARRCCSCTTRWSD